MGFLSSIARLFGATPASTYKTVEIYDSLRSQVLSLRPEQVGAKKEDQVIAVLMETGYPEAVATLVSVVDGAASLYFSSGGGIIGGGENERPNAASMKLVRLSASFLRSMSKAETTPLPKKGFTRFYVVTPSGLLTAEAKEEDLGEGRHALSPLFHAAHELITEVRLIDEQRREKG
ncbi:MAG: hypothetical protein ACREIA_11640 [Opitutaceae bacterium]